MERIASLERIHSLEIPRLGMVSLEATTGPPHFRLLHYKGSGCWAHRWLE